MAKIGICDWGIGGLGVYKELRKRGSNADIVYFSDSGYTPYGKVPKDELHERWLKVKSFFEDEEVDQIIVACNALSTVVQEQGPIVIIATAVRRVVEDNRNQAVGIIGGIRTIESGIYDLGYGHLGSVAQPLSALVESGIIVGAEVEETIRNVVEPISSSELIVLACTHYPVLIPVFRKLYPTKLFIDPVNNLFEKVSFPMDGNCKADFHTSGNIKEMESSAEKVWGLQLKNVRNSIQN
ncbi:MAG: aspartate/glutamate racemase family protein [Flavobacteriales bacterium]|nr:aspartate/glutamate racemase family protein [Flavobacteriales bacterium]